jgi:hypothetical protein
MNWHQAGKPTDSDQLAAWLIGQGVPQSVVTSVFGKMGIPYTAPAAQATAQPAAPAGAKAAPATASRSMPWVGNNPATGKPWTAGEIRDRGIVRRKDDLVSQTQQVAADAAADPNALAAMKTDSLRDLASQEISGATAGTAPTGAATSTAAGTFPGEDPNGPGYVGRREVARRQAARASQANTAPAKPNFAQQGGGYKSVNYAPNIKTGVNLPKPTAPAAPTGTKVTAGGPTADEKAKLDQRIAQALKQPVAEMLQMVETKEDIQRIKQFVDDTFVRYGAVNESAFAVRNQILEHVTQIGAQRRREHSHRVAH